MPCTVTTSSLGDIWELLENGKSIIITSVNYEDRSIALLKKMVDHFFQNEKKPRCKFKVYVFKSRTNNMTLLEQVKEENLEEVRQKLKRLNIEPELEYIEYPVGFDKLSVIYRTENWLKALRSEEEKVNIIFDITAFPRRVIIFFLEAFYRQKEYLENIFFTYFSPEVYSMGTIQDVGTIIGVFTGYTLDKLVASNHRLKLTVIPSLWGYETRLLLDEIQNLNIGVKELNFIVPLYNNDMLTSLEVLRMNPFIIRESQQHYYNLHYTFSMLDAFELLYEISKQETEKDIHLIAPFNVKPLVVAAFCAYKDLEEKEAMADILFCSRFFYTSFYSKGIGETFCFKLRWG